MRETPPPSVVPRSLDGTVLDVVLPVEREHPSRRSFLKLVGFGVASATLAGCSRGPMTLVVPRPEGPGGVVPGRGYWVATTCDGCDAACGVLARCRDGRPVKLEGNPDHALSRGGLCAVGQASVLDLYDGQRLDGPLLDGKPAEWTDVDDRVSTALIGGGAGVRILSRTITSPSTRAWVERVVKRTGGKHVEVDAPSCSALLDAHEAAFGRRALPRMHFDRARVIASFDADFLGTWIAPVEFAKAYRAGRTPDAAEPKMSRHVQIESRLSLTGCSADTRWAVAPWELRAALAALCVGIGKHAGTKVDLPVASDAPRAEDLGGLADELWAARGHSLVVCGSDDPAVQALAVLANHMLGNYGKTIDLARPSLQRRGNDRALGKLIEDMAAGAVKVLVIHGRDPLEELPDGAGFADALKQVELVVSTSPRKDATAVAAHVVAPTPHRLESWNDAEPVDGHMSLAQPTVPPLRSARTLRASLANWSGDGRDDPELLRAYWREHVLPRAGSGRAFDRFFDQVLHDGYVAVRRSRGVSLPRLPKAELMAMITRAAGPPVPPAGELALVLFPKVALPESRHAHNPWLQEMPDPLTTGTWGNTACLAPETAKSLDLEDGDVVRVEADGAAIELPVRVQPGQHPRVVAVATAYGVHGTDRFSRIGPSWLEGRLTVRDGSPVGQRAAPFAELTTDGLRTSGRIVSVTATGAHEDLASTQDHHRLEVPKHLAVPHGEVRDHARETTFATWRDDPDHALHRHTHAATDLWPTDHESDGPDWGLAVDLSACNGCSGCVVACQAENNVPAVGKDEVRRHREMTWLRVDRYFVGEGEDLRVAHQPMMCQHCGNAPCETVCPVLATVRSSDGLNQQVYNRCVGTRYCANNCPYKVRRFNWFEYPRTEELRNLALNPDVTVRSRGVMEKCSMCVQRIQEAKAEARRTGREVADGDIHTACQQSCPADAITFGDLNDPESGVAKLAQSKRGYTVLGELNVKPGVTYLARVRNGPGNGGGEHE